ncbi:hypothetical protein [Propionivibrio sp.]|uniref:hypothetical protein n=1 Tax=Propionivibrio sp. TaxID=2212460 RepID=UPI0039E329A6
MNDRLPDRNHSTAGARKPGSAAAATSRVGVATTATGGAAASTPAGGRSMYTGTSPANAAAVSSAPVRSSARMRMPLRVPPSCRCAAAERLRTVDRPRSRGAVPGETPCAAFPEGTGAPPAGGRAGALMAGSWR